MDLCISLNFLQLWFRCIFWHPSPLTYGPNGEKNFLVDLCISSNFLQIGWNLLYGDLFLHVIFLSQLNIPFTYRTVLSLVNRWFDPRPRNIVTWRNMCHCAEMEEVAIVLMNWSFSTGSRKTVGKVSWEKNMLFRHFVLDFLNCSAKCNKHGPCHCLQVNMTKTFGRIEKSGSTETLRNKII